MTRRRSGRVAGTRAGFTLVEVMVVTVLTVIVMGVMVMTLARQQRFYRATAELLEARSQVRQAAAILPTDIRGISTVGGDIVSMSATHLELRATFGSSVVCAIAGGSIIVPPANVEKGNSVTTWAAAPATGDSVFVYDDVTPGLASDDQWRAYEIGNALTWETGTCPTSTGLRMDADADKLSLKFNTTQALSATIKAGAPMRYVRRVRYSLYQAGNGSWYLGYCAPTCDAGGPQAVAGPFIPVSGPNGPGVSFTYLNSAGAVTANPAEVTRIGILVGARTRSAVGLTGFQSAVIGDSLRLTLAIRNHK